MNPIFRWGYFRRHDRYIKVFFSLIWNAIKLNCQYFLVFFPLIISVIITNLLLKLCLKKCLKQRSIQKIDHSLIGKKKIIFSVKVKCNTFWSKANEPHQTKNINKGIVQNPFKCIVHSFVKYCSLLPLQVTTKNVAVSFQPTTLVSYFYYDKPFRNNSIIKAENFDSRLNFFLCINIWIVQTR